MLDEIRTKAWSGRIDEAHAELEEMAKSEGVAAEQLGCARLALELGFLDVALMTLQIAHGRFPDNSDIAAELAQLYHDRGEHDRADRVLPPESSEEADVFSVPVQTEGTEDHEQVHQEPSLEPNTSTDEDFVEALAPSKADLVRFCHLFAGREHVHARQWYDPHRGTGYSPVEQPMTPGLVQAHLDGSITMGIYPVRSDQTVNFFAFDLDIVKRAVERARGNREETIRLRRLLRETGREFLEVLEAQGVPALLADSGYKGRHLWVLLDEPMSADLVRKAAIGLSRLLVLPSVDFSLEVFPKQGQVSDDQLGNLIKLPLGVHKRSGRRAWFLDQDDKPVKDPWKLLRSTPRMTQEQIFDILDRVRDLPIPEQLEDLPPDALPRPSAQPDRPLFTEANFDQENEVGALKRRCPVLEKIIEKGLEERRLSHDEQVVLRHTMGHIPAGVLAVNYVFQRCPEVPPSQFLQTPLSGNPMSCPKIRKRIPELTSSVKCHCRFTVNPDHYPTPVLHVQEARARGEILEGAPKAEPRAVMAEDLARTYVHLDEKLKRLQTEYDDVRKRFVDALGLLPGRTLPMPDGRWVLEDVESMPVITWKSADLEES